MRFLYLLLIPTCFAGTNSIQLANGTFSFSGSPFTSVVSQHWDFRFHDWTAPGTTTNTFCGAAGTLCVTISAANVLTVTNSKDSTANSLDITGHTDVAVRFSRDVPNKLTNLEVFDNTTGVCLSNTQNITSLGNNDWSGTGGGLVAIANFKFAYLRWFPNGLPSTICQNPPTEVDSLVGSLGAWEFENSLTDSSGHGNSITLSGPTYSTTPIHFPICQGQDSGTNFTNIQVLKANKLSSVTQVSCNSESFGPNLNYSWSLGTFVGGSLFSPTLATPGVMGSTFGEGTLNLAVSDSVPNTTNVSITFGVVVSDARDLVITGNSVVDKILGPMPRFGAPFTTSTFEDWNRLWVQLLGNDQTTLDYYLAQFNTALPGSISFVNTGGNTIVTGVGTDFQNKYCSGGTSQAANAILIAWVPDLRTASGSRRVFLQGNGTLTCNSSTQITISPQYNGVFTPGQSMSYAIWPFANNWVGISENINYYDNIMAFYALYYRTGRTIFHTYATTLADNWFMMPYFNQGWNDCNVDVCVAPRIYAFTGLVLRANDGRSDMLAGLSNFVDNQASKLTSWINDVREQAYSLSWPALFAFIDPNPTHLASMLTTLGNSINNVWRVQRLSTGVWTDNLGFGSVGYATCSFGCTSALSGTVTATTGSYTLTLTGSTWSAASFPTNCTLPCSIWLVPNNSYVLTKDNSGGDTKSFKVISFTDSTHLVIDRAYDGSLAGTGLGYWFGGGTGSKIQPFMLGVVAGAMGYVYNALLATDPTNANLAKSYAIDAVNFIILNGTILNYNAINYFGLFYYRIATNCEPLSKALLDANCTQTLDNNPTNIQGLVYLNMEVMHGFSVAYELSGSQLIKDSGEWLFNTAFSPSSPNNLGPGYLNAGTFDYNNNHAKTLGFKDGWGQGYRWEATRVQGSFSSKVGLAGSGYIQ